MTGPLHKNPFPGCREIYNFARPFLGHSGSNLLKVTNKHYAYWSKSTTFEDTSSVIITTLSDISISDQEKISIMNELCHISENPCLELRKYRAQVRRIQGEYKNKTQKNSLVICWINNVFEMGMYLQYYCDYFLLLIIISCIWCLEWHVNRHFLFRIVVFTTQIWIHIMRIFVPVQLSCSTRILIDTLWDINDNTI